MTQREIFFLFDGKLVGNKQLKNYVCKTLTVFPEEIVSFITNHCWFMGTMDDAWAYAFTGNDLKDQHLIFLSDELLVQNSTQVHFTIAHEIGHIILKHKNSVSYVQSKAEVSRQEKEADNFAHRYGF